MAPARCLLLASDGADAGAALAYVGKTLSGDTDVLRRNHSAASSAEFKDASFDAVVSVNNATPDASLLTEMMRLVKASGSVAVQAPEDAKPSRALMFAGFSDIETVNGVTTAKKAAWDEGASAELKGADAAAAPVAAVWSLAAGDLNDDDLDLEDEDELLQNEVLKVDQKAVAASYDDCGESGKPSRKACKDCSCGRAEMEAAEEAGEKPAMAMEFSSCGSCGLGDAFRCSTCPFLGQPAFEDKGDTVKLKL